MTLVVCCSSVAVLPSHRYGAVRPTPHSWIGSRGPVKSPALVGWWIVPTWAFTPPPLMWQVPQDSPAFATDVEKNSWRPRATRSAWDTWAVTCAAAFRIWSFAAFEMPGSPWTSPSLSELDGAVDDLWLLHAATTTATPITRVNPRRFNLLSPPVRLIGSPSPRPRSRSVATCRPGGHGLRCHHEAPSTIRVAATRSMVPRVPMATRASRPAAMSPKGSMPATRRASDSAGTSAAIGLGSPIAVCGATTSWAAAGAGSAAATGSVAEPVLAVRWTTGRAARRRAGAGRAAGAGLATTLGAVSAVAAGVRTGPAGDGSPK